jgi:hypothetical protein
MGGRAVDVDLTSDSPPGGTGGGGGGVGLSDLDSLLESLNSDIYPSRSREEEREPPGERAAEDVVVQSVEDSMDEDEALRLAIEMSKLDK